MTNLLRALGWKTLGLILLDLFLVFMSLFTGTLSALAYDREPWGRTFWLLSLASGVSSLGSAVIGWWAWYEIRKK